MRTAFLAVACLTFAGCVSTHRMAVATPPTTLPAAGPTAAEFAELRWELGPDRRTVVFERPGDQFHGKWFQDVMDHLGLTRAEPANTPKATSSELLTALSRDGWEVITHAMTQDAGDVHVEVWTLRRAAR